MPFNIEEFNFAYIEWLDLILFLPIIWLIYLLFYRRPRINRKKLEAFADSHLIPHLLKGDGNKKGSVWPTILLWSLLWVLLSLAIAGPRWDYEEIETFEADTSMVILLDLSRSMDVMDEKPSRLARARQEIEDILKYSRGINIGLIAFAAVPHMVSPITNDKNSIRYFLPSLSSKLVKLQGSNIATALKMASRMLDTQAGDNKLIVVFTDGGFANKDIAQLAKVVSEDTKLFVMGVGTAEGEAIPNVRGGWFKDANGRLVMSRLEEANLQTLASAANGQYIKTNYLETDTAAIIGFIENAKQAGDMQKQKQRNWHERFYYLVAIIMVLLLPWFRKDFVFLTFVTLMFLPNYAFAEPSWFANTQQQAKQQFDSGNFGEAAKTFDSNYNKGVAHYRAGNYKDAEAAFSASQHQHAYYNQGNAQLMQGKIKKAIKTYEKVLAEDPDHVNAKYNLDVAKKLLEQQPPSPEDEQEEDQQEDEEEQEDQQNNEQQEQGDNQDQPEEKDDQQADQEDENQNDDNTQKEQDQEAQPDEGNEKQDDNQQNDKAEEQQDDAQQKQPQPDPTQNGQQQNPLPEPEAEQGGPRTPADVNADQWLNRIDTDPSDILSNQFLLEEANQQGQDVGAGGIPPW